MIIFSDVGQAVANLRAQKTRTLLTALGIAPDTELPSPGGRPLPVAEYSAKPITELL